jgi:hypothetical protein
MMFLNRVIISRGKGRQEGACERINAKKKIQKMNGEDLDNDRKVLLKTCGIRLTGFI